MNSLFTFPLVTKASVTLSGKNLKLVEMKFPHSTVKKIITNIKLKLHPPIPW